LERAVAIARKRFSSALETKTRLGKCSLSGKSSCCSRILLQSSNNRLEACPSRSRQTWLTILSPAAQPSLGFRISPAGEDALHRLHGKSSMLRAPCIRGFRLRRDAQVLPLSEVDR
jgi:hypothetical protein